MPQIANSRSMQEGWREWAMLKSRLFLLAAQILNHTLL